MIKKKYIVFKVIKFRENFIKMFVTSNFSFETLILKDIKIHQKIEKGDLIEITGAYRYFKGIKELHLTSIVKIGKLSSDFNYIKNQKLFIRSITTNFIHNFFRDEKLCLIQSPTITSSWVEGNTVPFKVKYYDTDKYLSISNLIYHQIMIASGMTEIYEIGVLHREELSSGNNKLSEFTTIDMSKIGVSIGDICSIFEKLIVSLLEYLQSLRFYEISFIDNVRFESITYNDLLCNSNVEDFEGSQLPLACRKYLNENYSSFVWVTNFNVTKRPFYTKSDGVYAKDVQLWYKGEKYFAAGSEIETDISKIKKNLMIKNRNINNYETYIEYASKGFPEMSMVSMGLEMLLSCLVNDSKTIEFNAFPRTDKTIFF